MQQQPGNSWPRPPAPPLGRPPPPPPPTRPLAPPLPQQPPPPPLRPPTSLSPFHAHPALPTSQEQLPHTSTHTLTPPSQDPPQPPTLPTHSDTSQPDTSSTSATESKGSSESDKSSPTAIKPGGFVGVKFKSTGGGGGGMLGKRSGGAAISMKIGAPKAAPDAKRPKVEAKKPALVSQAFGNDSDDEVEEMPPEAKLKMRNVGKDTPTSAGPNSFYKGKMGFCDPRAGFKRYSEED